MIRRVFRKDPRPSFLEKQRVSRLRFADEGPSLGEMALLVVLASLSVGLIVVAFLAWGLR